MPKTTWAMRHQNNLGPQGVLYLVQVVQPGLPKATWLSESLHIGIYFLLLGPGRSSAAWNNAKLYLRLPEDGLVARNDDIAHHGDLTTATQAKAIDRYMGGGIPSQKLKHSNSVG